MWKFHQTPWRTFSSTTFLLFLLLCISLSWCASVGESGVDSNSNLNNEDKEPGPEPKPVNFSYDQNTEYGQIQTSHDFPALRYDPLEGNFDGETCDLPQKLVQEIRGMSGVIDEIKQKVKGEFKGKTYEEVAEFVDFYGPRLVGTPMLEKAIDVLQDKMENSTQLENIFAENVPVYLWKRGIATVELLSPVKKSLSVLTFGPSIATPKSGIDGEIFRVVNLKDLEENSEKVKDKVVLFDFVVMKDFFFETAFEASKYGALAVLVRAYTPFSLYTPHTRATVYSKNVKKIPAFCITVEDSAFITRMLERGHKVQVSLYTNSSIEYGHKSRNLFGTLPGQNSNENGKSADSVLISSHSDSWDVGQGAQDDGIGLFININTIRIIQSLSTRPKRDILLALWTSEENGLNGALYHYKNKKNADEAQDIAAALEADTGCLLRPHGWEFADMRPGKGIRFGCILYEIGKMLGPNYSNLTGGYTNALNQPDQPFKPLDFGSDVGVLVGKNVPAAILNGNGDGKYFYYHHTFADTVTTYDAQAIDKCLTFYAATSYILANLSSI